MALGNETRLRLLELLQNLGTGVADAHSHDPDRQRRMLYPIPEHLRAIEPEVVLVIGDRGAGKSHLKDVLRDVDLRKALTRYVPRTQMANEAVDWVEAWLLGKEGPESGTWREFVASHRERPEDISDLWLALLVRRLGPHLPGEAKVAALAGIRATRPGELLDTFRATRADFIHVLDSLDHRLEAERRWLVASYDELDTVSLDWASLGAVVRASSTCGSPLRDGGSGSGPRSAATSRETGAPCPEPRARSRSGRRAATWPRCSRTWCNSGCSRSAATAATTSPICT